MSTLALTEEQRRLRVVNLSAQIQSMDNVIQEIIQRAGGVKQTYSRSQYGSKAKAMQDVAIEEYKKQHKELLQRRNIAVQEIREHQKKMEKPIISFQDKDGK